jgi:hypothetical protein
MKLDLGVPFDAIELNATSSSSGLLKTTFVLMAATDNRAP